eukprot:CAMPEP_0180246278 /NCGR_PEP_ID=MMETSP0987-20121128/35475_1 /TAXON_ID=697907 /ORGANISM="non described non described, Strain CCMP2293" /LENGTH=79 /DNA_ID=CAMNT_0022214055 /DNA_START=97 /DNA_END=333 /DNA_ORIENTATION=+
MANHLRKGGFPEDCRDLQARQTRTQIRSATGWALCPSSHPPRGCLDESTENLLTCLQDQEHQCCFLKRISAEQRDIQRR